MLQKIVCIVFFSLINKYSSAADSLYVKMNKKSLKKGDTLKVDCYFNFKTKAHAAISLNVWIQNIPKTNTWKFRYPILNGKCSFDLIVNDNLPDAHYAFNFLVQPSFFALKGKVKNYKPDRKGLLMLMLDKTIGSYVKPIALTQSGDFSVGKLVFSDTANFIFSEVGNKKNDVTIQIQTPLDSVFSPIVTETRFVTIGTPKINANNTLTYILDEKTFKDSFNLQEVVVKSTIRKSIEKFDASYATSLFSGGKVFDGLDDNQIAMAGDVLLFLNGRVTGLQVSIADEGYTINRRGSEVDVYIDEYRVDANSPIFVSSADVAMIKVFDPMDGPRTAPGGSIAIYTKRGVYAGSNTSKNYFRVKGYTPSLLNWK